tara:strand:- start:1423 stop:2613 length:1191 start_codon:yes stop_codon:yes gene_type:complete
MFAKGRITTTGDVFRDEKSLAFDGTNDYVNVDGLSSVFSTDSAFSLVFWFKCLNVGHGGGDDEHKEIIFSAHDSTDSYANILRLGVNPNNDSSPIGGIFVVDNSGNTTIYTDNGSADSGTKYFNNGKWHHLVLTNASGAGNTTSNVYIDGVQLTNYYTTSGGSDTNTLDVQWSDADKFSIAQEYDGSAAVSDNFFGNISEVAIYNSALTINQVKTIYNGREPYNHKEGVASGNLQAWYRMGDGSLDEYALIGDETNITLGNNLITNGTFDADSDWAKSGSGATISSGQATLDLDADTFIYQDVGTVGKVYKMTFDLVVTSGEVKLGTNADFQYTYSAGTYTNESVYLIATTTNRFIFRRATGDLEATIDNVSVQQVGDNAGIMNNMSATDIEGDTP